jgi:Flavin reductase like domain
MPSWLLRAMITTASSSPGFSSRCGTQGGTKMQSPGSVSSRTSRLPLTPSAFRDAIGHFATGVTVVTSVGPGGEPIGTTANAVTSLSLDPPLVLVCFDRASSTLEAVRAHGAFVINVLTAPLLYWRGSYISVMGSE